MVIETLKCNCEYEGTNLEYTYTLIQRKMKLNFSDDEQEIDAYGVKIESKIFDNDNIIGFKEEIKYVTPYKYKGSKFLHMLEKNMVSPIHLIDITEEIIENYVKDFDEIFNKDLALVTV